MINKKFQNFGSKVLALLLTAAIIVLGELCICSFVRTTTVCGHSMSPTLSDGASYVTVMTAYNPAVRAKRDDIVLVDSKLAQEVIIKRVIAQPGDILEIRDNQVYVNEVALKEGYILEDMVTQDIPKFRLAEGHYFVMGDNRNNSTDSRVIGTIPEEEIIGVVYLRQQLQLWILFPAALLSFGLIVYEVCIERKAIYWLLRRCGICAPSQPAPQPDGEQVAAPGLT